MIHWQYIKGLNQITGNSPVNVFTFIHFSKAVKQEAQYDFSHAPSIIISPENDIEDDNITDFGHIITQLAENQSIDKEFSFNNTVHFNDNSSNNQLNIFNGRIYKKYNNSAYIDYIYFVNDSSQTAQHKIILNTETFEVDATTLLANATIDNSGHSIKTNSISVESGTGGDGSCEAVYFNATSDKRAKTDFSLLDINALELVKKVQLYSFKYKDSNLPSIGIIAQDVQDVNIKGFKLVDNENATGQDFDYMTIHESKLTYILWKAVQELSKEVEELRKQLNK